MSTVTEPEAKVERASRAHVAALILKATVEAGLPYPKQIDFTSYLWIEVESVDELRLWMAHLGATYEKDMPRRHPTLPMVMHWAELLDFHGWSVTIKTSEPVSDEPCCSYLVASDGVKTHRAGCLAAAPECVDCGVPGGGHQESCAFASRVNPEAAARIPVLVLDVTPNPAPSPDIDDTIARLFDDDARLAVDELDDLPAVSVAQLAEAATVEPDAREYVPTGYRDPKTGLISGGLLANCSSCGKFHPGGVEHTEWLARTDAPLPQRTPGAALGDVPTIDPWLDEDTLQMPCASVPIGVEVIHIEGHAVQAPADAYGTDEDRSGAEIGHLIGGTS